MENNMENNKQTMVSIWYRGIRTPFLVEADISQDGTAKISEKQLNNMLNIVGVLPGITYSIGT